MGTKATGLYSLAKKAGLCASGENKCLFGQRTGVIRFRLCKDNRQQRGERNRRRRKEEQERGGAGDTVQGQPTDSESRAHF